MAARKPPTERQRRLGTELRKMREQVGLSLTEAAELHRVDKATISNTESARFGVSADRVRVWATNYACPDRAYVDALADMARERGKNWWDEYRAVLPAVLLDLAELERHATALRTAQLTHMPGLLQNEDYARAVFKEAVPELGADDLDRKVEFRVRRCSVLDAAEPPSCTFLIHEAALRMLFGGARVMKSQLDHLLEQSERSNVTVRVLPFTVGGFPSAGSSAMYACGPVQRLDTVQSDTPLGSRFLHADTHLANYRLVLDRMEERALDPDRSCDLIREVGKQL
ncbi:Scr1 family TA system antitoxin-like transcriptional regulator [Streptomyces poonensis]|uniref:Transcriptional regulator n=1 Tax=Streptomyces poonensis TaxID=68255 RepID=A0A918UJ33_9ACTN|nr:Scr1 family TA system antitoxin-like transcriptional regulator [Streptomyces poonensis]GGZ13370.1 transcriptional regulator [Streptomyces poonensis]GLJ91199.1 transcriptional regulator [Streptomyces poonensis]